MAKKRTSLEALLGPKSSDESESNEVIKAAAKSKQSQANRDSAVSAATSEPAAIVPVALKSEIVKQTVYLPAGVHEQLRLLAFEERRKMHDYLVEGLDRVFRDRGLKPFDELTNSKK